jgi:excisionase family DNA binding protein
VTGRLPAGAAAVITATLCGYLVRSEQDILAGWRRDGLAPPADLVDALATWRAIAVDARLAARSRTPELAGSGLVPELGAGGSGAAVSWVTAKEAAERLRISERAVTKAIQQGRLSGRRIAGGSRWEVTDASVDRYRPRKAPLPAAS